jgi:hypothetical protein
LQAGWLLADWKEVDAFANFADGHDAQEEVFLSCLPDEVRHAHVRLLVGQFGRDIGVDEVPPSQNDVAARVPVAFEVDIEPAERREEFNHILRGRFGLGRRRKGYRFFEQSRGMRLDSTPR